VVAEPLRGGGLGLRLRDEAVQQRRQRLAHPVVAAQAVRVRRRDLHIHTVIACLPSYISIQSSSGLLGKADQLAAHPLPAVGVLLRPLLQLLGHLQREDVALAGAPGAVVAAHRAALAPEHPHPERSPLALGETKKTAFIHSFIHSFIHQLINQSINPFFHPMWVSAKLII